MEPLMPTVTGRSRPWTDHRLAVEGMAWKYRTGAPWRDVPERFGKWNSIYKRFNRWAENGTWEKLLAEVQTQTDAAGRIDWSCPSTPRSRVCISTARPSRGTQGALPNHKNPWFEPPDHGIGRSRGGLTTKLHVVCDGARQTVGDDDHRREHQRPHDDDRRARGHPRAPRREGSAPQPPRPSPGRKGVPVQSEPSLASRTRHRGDDP